MTNRMYESDEKERASLIGWLERRLNTYANYMTIPLYVSVFRKMWRESFGNEDDVPEDLKELARRKYDERKAECDARKEDYDE